MRSLRYGWLLIFLFLTALSWGKQTSQQAPAPQATRDPQAVAALQQAVAAMGAALPSDSVATGSVIVVAGTETDQGTIRILTRGTDQTLEQTDTPQAVRTEVFSQGQASETVGTAATPFPLERAATAQCRDFPLPYLLALLNNSEETLAGGKAFAVEFSGGPRFSSGEAWVFSLISHRGAALKSCLSFTGETTFLFAATANI